MEGESNGLSLFEFVTDVCANASRNGEGLIMAIEDGYAAENADVFLRVDSVAAHHPECTFRNTELSELLEDAVLPTIGVLNVSANDAETWALQTGYARDRVIAYQRCKSSVLAAHSVAATVDKQQQLAALPTSVRGDLQGCEEHVMKGTAPVDVDAHQYTACKRTAWEARYQHDRTPSLMDNVEATGISRKQIDGLTTGAWDDEDSAVRDQKIGTERFVAFSFAPSDHQALVAANATGGGVRVEESVMAYPAYVTVHNSKGAIEHLPATATEQQPNSVIVPCAASLLCELHSLSAKAGRNHVLIVHRVNLK